MSSTAKTNAALAAAIIFLALSSFAAYFAFARLRTSQQWVQHTRDVQLALHQFATFDTRAARQRAEYIDSGDVTVLDRYAQSLTDARNQLNKIQQLTAEVAQLKGMFEQAIAAQKGNRSLAAAFNN